MGVSLPRCGPSGLRGGMSVRCLATQGFVVAVVFPMQERRVRVFRPKPMRLLQRP